MELANNVTTTLVKYAAGLKYEDIPQDVIHMTKRVFMDIIGCGLGSHELDKGRIGYSLAHQLGGTPEATVLGTGFDTFGVAVAVGKLLGWTNTR